MLTPYYAHTQANIRNKVNASDLTSLMPQGDSGETASLLPKVLEVQSRVATLEGTHERKK